MFDPQTSAFTITAVDAINAGFPVSDSYGRKCNSRYHGVMAYQCLLRD